MKIVIIGRQHCCLNICKCKFVGRLTNTANLAGLSNHEKHLIDSATSDRLATNREEDVAHVERPTSDEHDDGDGNHEEEEDGQDDDNYEEEDGQDDDDGDVDRDVDG